MKITEMPKDMRRSITVQAGTYERFRKLGNLSTTYDEVLSALLDIGERRLKEERLTEEPINTQR
jgi:hypothetical protein